LGKVVELNLGKTDSDSNGDTVIDCSSPKPFKKNISRAIVSATVGGKSVTIRLERLSGKNLQKVKLKSGCKLFRIV